MSKLTLLQFYRDRFNCDPKLLLADSEAVNQLTADAALASIDWSSVAGKIDPSNMGGKNRDKYTGRIDTLESKYKGRVAIYANLRTSDDGTFDYPTVNFVLKGSPEGGWSGLSLLAKLYKEHKGTITQEDRFKWQKQNELKQKEIHKKQQVTRKREFNKQQEKQSLNLKYDQLFSTSPKESGDQLYITNKMLNGIEQYVDIRRCVEFDNKYSLGRKGQEFLAIRFVDIDGQYCGIQRIYEDGTKLNTPGFNFDNGAHCVIGDILNAKTIYAGEGFATCASAYLAFQSNHVAVLVGINSTNLKKVLTLFKHQCPEIKLTLLADNDQWKNQQGLGNAGMKLACYAVDTLGYKAVYPTFDDFINPKQPLDERPTDFNDLHCVAGLSNVRKQLRSHDNRFQPSPKNPFEQTCRLLQFTESGYVNPKTKQPNGKKIKQLAEKALLQGAQLYPIHFDEHEIVNRIHASTQHAHAFFNVNEFFSYLVGKIDWITKKRIKDAQDFRSFSQDILDKPNINYMKFAETFITSEIFNIIKSLSGMVVVRAPMGSGKTQHMISPLMESANKGLYFAHRVSLIASSVGNLNKRRTITTIKGVEPVSLNNLEHVFVKNFSPLKLDKPKPSDDLVQNYQDFKGSGMGIFARNIDQMGMCINSITNSSFSTLLSQLDICTFDEAAQTLRHVADGSACDKPEAVYNAMLHTIKQTKGQVILCDADANDEVIELCEQARPGEVIHVVELATDFSDIKIKYTDNGDQVFNQVFKAVEKGEKCLIANDSATNGRAMYNSLKNRFEKEGKKFLFIYQDSKGNADVEAFNQNPDLAVEQEQYDAVIYSPCISSGVSLESGYFTKHFAILCGSVAPSDAIQMIRRDRNAKEFIIGFNKQNTRFPETKEEIVRGMLAADALNMELDLSDSQMTLSRAYTPFDDIRINIIAKQNKARNDFANNMLLILQGDKYQLERIANDSVEKEIGKTQRSIGREIAIERDMQLQLNEETPDESTAERLKREDCISEAEQAQLKRFDIENQLCAEVNESTIEFNNDRGLSKVKRFELVQGEMNQAAQFDVAEISNNISFNDRSRKYPKMKMLHKVFDLLGIDRKTGEGQFTGEHMRTVRDHLLSSEDNIYLYNSNKIGPYVHPKTTKVKCETTLVKNILNRLGLDLSSTIKGKERKRVSYICPQSWSTMKSYFNARQENNLTSLEPMQYDTDAVVDTRSALSIDISKLYGTDHLTIISDVKPFNSLYSCISGALTGLSLSFEEAVTLLNDEDMTDILSGEMPSEMLRSFFASKAKIEHEKHRYVDKHIAQN